MSRYVEPHAELNTLVDIAKELRTANTLKVIEEARKLADVDYDDMLDKTLASLFTEYLK